MATIKLYQKPRKGKTHHPLYLRITHDRKSRLVNLDIRIAEDDWNENQQKVRKTHPNYKWLNNFLKGKRAEAQQEILKVREKSKNGVTADILKQAVEGSWQDWRLRLVPIRPEIREVVQAVSVAGRGAQIRTVTTLEVNGDKSVIDLTPNHGP